MIQSESRETKWISFHLSFTSEGEGEISIPRWHFTGNEAEADILRKEVKEQFNKLNAISHSGWLVSLQECRRNEGEWLM